MTRRILLFVSLVMILIAGLIIGITALVRGNNNENPDLVLNFCERNPNALVCTEDTETTNEDFAHDMFLTLLNTYSSGYSDEFCEDYFTGKIVAYCKETTSNIMPSSTINLSKEFKMEEVSEGIYDVETVYNYADLPALTFRIAIVEIDDLYVFSGISYYDTPPVINLNLEESWINDFMTNMIKTSDDGLSDYCETFFSADAYELCENGIQYVAPNITTINHYIVEEENTNEYLYTTYNVDSSERVEYLIFFEIVDEQVLITEIETTEYSNN